MYCRQLANEGRLPQLWSASTGCIYVSNRSVPICHFQDIRSIAIKYRDIGNPHGPMYGTHFRLSDASDS